MLDYFPHTNPIRLGSEERDDRRVDTFLVREAGGDRAYSVLSLKIDATFVPDIVSEYPHIPYATAHANAKPPRWNEVGVYATSTTVHSPAATRARFSQCGAVREAPVIAAHCVLYDWDKPWLAAENRPQPIALFIDRAWTPTVSSLVAATPEDFKRGYLAHEAAEGDDRREHEWAREPFWERGYIADRIAMIEAILDGDDVPGSVLGSLSAGPVEDLIGHELLDHVNETAERRARWAELLRWAYWVNEPPDIRHRLVDLLGGPSA